MKYGAWLAELWINSGYDGAVTVEVCGMRNLCVMGCCWWSVAGSPLPRGKEALSSAINTTCMPSIFLTASRRASRPLSLDSLAPLLVDNNNAWVSLNLPARGDKRFPTAPLIQPCHWSCLFIDCGQILGEWRKSAAMECSLSGNVATQHKHPTHEKLMHPDTSKWHKIRPVFLGGDGLDLHKLAVCQHESPANPSLPIPWGHLPFAPWLTPWWRKNQWQCATGTVILLPLHQS